MTAHGCDIISAFQFNLVFLLQLEWLVVKSVSAPSIYSIYVKTGWMPFIIVRGILKVIWRHGRRSAGIYLIVRGNIRVSGKRVMVPHGCAQSYGI